VAESTEAEHAGWIEIRPDSGLSIRLGELWTYRELLGFFAWRDVAVRYKQSLLGVLWALLTPLITVVIFTVIFGGVAGIGSHGIPYPVFCYVGLLPWLFFAQSVQRATASMVAERNKSTFFFMVAARCDRSQVFPGSAATARRASAIALSMIWRLCWTTASVRGSSLPLPSASACSSSATAAS